MLRDFAAKFRFSGGGTAKRTEIRLKEETTCDIQLDIKTHRNKLRDAKCTWQRPMWAVSEPAGNVFLNFIVDTQKWPKVHKNDRFTDITWEHFPSAHIKAKCKRNTLDGNSGFREERLKCGVTAKSTNAASPFWPYKRIINATVLKAFSSKHNQPFKKHKRTNFDT